VLGIVLYWYYDMYYLFVWIIVDLFIMRFYIILFLSLLYTRLDVHTWWDNHPYHVVFILKRDIF
jgi:hypothetical protein